MRALADSISRSLFPFSAHGPERVKYGDEFVTLLLLFM